MRKKEVLFAVIGGVVGAVLTMAAGSIAPLGAQNEVKDVEFGKIACRGITVKNQAMPGQGVTVGPLGVGVWGDEGSVDLRVKSGAGIRVSDGRGRVEIGVDEQGGLVKVRGKNGEGGARMGIDEHGGAVWVHGKDRTSMATMRIMEQGGFINCYSNTESSGTAGIGINEHGHGLVVVLDADGKVGAMMTSDEYGGKVSVAGRGNARNRTRAIVGVNEYGNGVVNTWDKDGYRSGRLK
ncbi:MAG: hypothetical protein OXN17_05630 [Candidatus Poribacteria bacterium]|nr:hypothetical protein [Candidatus Poribacteria bacterium]MDE0505304.1 hypothetical protein [Candidatus Poribacteria bacterium]